MDNVGYEQPVAKKKQTNEKIENKIRKAYNKRKNIKIGVKGRVIDVQWLPNVVEIDRRDKMVELASKTSSQSSWKDLLKAFVLKDL